MTRSRNSSLYNYLANNGPATNDELPYSVNHNAPMCITNFNLTANSDGSACSGGGRKTPVYYISGKHQPKTVVKKWAEVNEKTVEEVSGWALLNRAPDEFRDAVIEVIGHDRDLGEYEQHHEPNECPYCGESCRSIAKHIRRSDCP